ncbi:hypothetical protein HDU76_005578 [Blyttiomyces sp. JEL0837]|nr:hypothetical protein HDU76_005578 [Blyttiomyces sp. JEL0837]
MKILYKVTIKDGFISGEESIFYFKSSSPKPHLLNTLDKEGSKNKFWSHIVYQLYQNLKNFNDSSNSSQLFSVQDGELLSSDYSAIECLLSPHIQICMNKSKFDTWENVDVKMLFSSAASSGIKADSAVSSTESSNLHIKTKTISLMKFVMWALDFGDSGTGPDDMFLEFVNGLKAAQSRAKLMDAGSVTSLYNGSCDITADRMD